MKKTTILTGALLFAVIGGWAAEFSDDFNRTNTAQTAYTVNVGGTGWAQFDDGGSTGDDWFINNEVLRLRNRATEAILYNTTLVTDNGSGSGFTLKADMQGLQDGAYVGLIFNYADEENYYIVRFRAGYSTYQFLRKTSSGWDVLLNTSLSSGTFAEDTFYTVTVSSDAAGVFDFTIDEPGVGTVVSSTRIEDSAGALIDGYAALYGTLASPNHIAAFDNFDLQVYEYDELFSDVFNRTNTVQTAYTVNVDGSGWTQADDGGSTGDDWYITDEALRLRNRDANSILYNTDLKIPAGSNTSFTLSANVMGLQAGAYAGVVFNYMDEENYYVIRFRADNATYQFLQQTSSGWDVLLNTSLSSGTFAEDAYYTVTVTSTNEGVFEFSIDETGVGTVVSTTIDDSASALTNGYAGLYGTSGTGQQLVNFDNFRLAITGTLFGYDKWATEWGVDIGAATDDYDADGLNNLYEYGLGGDPTSGLDQGASPEYAVVNNVFQYVYPQLSDTESGLTYYLEVTSDLVAGIWTNNGYTVTGTNIAGSLDFVTNTVDMTDTQKFVRLVIE